MTKEWRGFLERVAGDGFLFFKWEPVRELPDFNLAKNGHWKKFTLLYCYHFIAIISVGRTSKI